MGIGALLTLVSAAMAFNWYHDPNIGMFRTAVGYFGVAFFGLGTCMFAWFSMSSGKPVVFIDRKGIRDTRLSNEPIEWRSVEKISVWQYRRQKLVMLKLRPLVAKRFERGGLRRLLSVANKALGADGVAIGTGALTMDAETLFDTCRRYSAAAESGQ